MLQIQIAVVPFNDPKKSYKVRELPQISVVFQYDPKENYKVRELSQISGSCMILTKTTKNFELSQISVVFLYSKKNYVHEYVTDSDCCCSFYGLKKNYLGTVTDFCCFLFRKTTKFMNYHSFMLFSFMILEKLQSSEFTNF